MHVRGVQVPLREVHERREITGARVIGIQVARATRGRDELIERTRGLVIHIEQRGREVHEKRVQTPCERHRPADGLGPAVPHEARGEVEVVPVRHRDDDVRLVLQDLRHRGRCDLGMGLVSSEGGEDREVRNILYADDKLSLTGSHLDERVLLRQCGTREPTEDWDPPRGRLEDSHRRGGLERRRERSLVMIEDERLRCVQVVADRPAIRRKDRQEGRRGRGIQFPQRAVVRADCVEGGPAAAGVVEENRKAVRLVHPCGEVRTHQERVVVRRDHRADVDGLRPRRIEHDKARGAPGVRVDRGLGGDVVMRDVESGGEIRQHRRRVPCDAGHVQVQLHAGPIHEALERGQ